MLNSKNRVFNPYLSNVTCPMGNFSLVIFMGNPSLRGGGGGVKTFSIFYMLISKNRVFNPYLSNVTCPMGNFSLVIFMGNPSLRLSEVLSIIEVS